MGIKITGGVKVPQGQFKVYVTPAGPTGHTLWAWGQGTYGQLGDGTAIKRSSPVQIGSLTDWAQCNCGVAAVHSIAIKTDGTLWTWGFGGSGRLGDGTTVTKSSPVQIGALTDWASFHGGGGHTLAVKTNGELWAWGNNSATGAGQLGQGDVIDRSSPIQVGSLTDWSKVSARNQSLAIKTDGTLWGWGSNVNGQIGDGTSVYKSSPVQIGALSDWSDIQAGSNFTIARKTDGSLWAWGLGTSGQLGDGAAINRSSPVQIGALTDWASVGAGDAFCAAIKTDGTLWTWGDNSPNGQLGLGDVIDRSSPVQVGSLTDWSNIEPGRDFSAPVKTDGTLWSWGENSANGTVGDGTVIDRSSPVQIGASTDWVSASGGIRHTIALRSV